LAFSNEKLRRTLQSIHLKPRQKYKLPMTSNQEIGWFQHLKPGENPKWSQPRKGNPITYWASEFEVLTKQNPFK